MHEGQRTNQNPKLAKLRKDEYLGRTIDITPHLKVGTKKPKLLRIHFCVDQDSKKIVVGHVGDHLKTYTTGKLKLG